MDKTQYGPTSHFPTSLAALQQLAPDAVATLLRHAQPMTLQAGEILFSAGQAFANAVYILRAGKMALQHPGEAALVIEPDRVLGMANYFDATPYLATVSALCDVELQVIPADRLRAAEEQYPELFSAVNRWLTALIRHQTAQPVQGAWALPARAIMKSPLVTCEPATTVQEAFAIMNRRRIGSLVVLNEQERLAGLVTFVSLADGLIADNAKSDDPVFERVCSPADTIDADAPLWKVQSEQDRLGAKYLVVQEDDKPVGIISQTDVLYALVSQQRSVIAQIHEAADFAVLKDFQGQLGQIARELRQQNRSAGLAVRALSEIHLAIQRRCIELVLAELRADGKGEPPAPFAFLIMGSGGRKEMMIKTDQDNGIILADRPETREPATREWFLDFGNRVNHRLDTIGYDWCTGDIMARNPDFHKTLAEWREHLSAIADLPTEKMARWSTIFFDFETLYGDDRLTVALRRHLFEELKRKPRLLKLMVQDDATGGPALGLFNRLVTASDKERKGRIDLKRNGTRILADVARIYALSEGIDATNTGDRISALVRQGRWDNAFAESVLAAYDKLLDITLDHQIRQLRNGEALDKLLRPEELTSLDEEALRMAMRVIKHLQGRMQGEFGTVML